MTPFKSGRASASARAFISLVLVVVLTTSVISPASASVEHLADAIWLAEGGEKAVVPYGILSVPCKDDCRDVCINSIRNNLWRYLEATDQVREFVAFMGARYAPENSHPLNTYWADNVMFFYERGAK